MSEYPSKRRFATAPKGVFEAGGSYKPCDLCKADPGILAASELGCSAAATEALPASEDALRKRGERRERWADK